MVVLYSDEYLALRNEDYSQLRIDNIPRFFKIMKNFPLELQMLICKMIYYSQGARFYLSDEVDQILKNEFGIFERIMIHKNSK